jgi:hypothetical protein
MIIDITLTAVAATESRMMNLANDFCLVKAILLAILNARLKKWVLGSQNYSDVTNAAKAFVALSIVVSLGVILSYEVNIYLFFIFVYWNSACAKIAR